MLSVEPVKEVPMNAELQLMSNEDEKICLFLL
jgi:hypothetical protein